MMTKPLFQIIGFAVLATGICAVSGLARADQPAASFHHVHLNVTDPEATIEHYVKFFGAVPVTFRGVSDALFTERSYILLSTVDDPPPSNAGTALWHIGWGGADGPNQFEFMTRQGATWDTELVTIGRDQGHFFYAEGPDGDLAEVFTGLVDDPESGVTLPPILTAPPHHRFNHVHLLATDINATRDWYMQTLGALGDPTPIPDPGTPPIDMAFTDPAHIVFSAVWNTAFVVDNVVFNVFVNPQEPAFWWAGDIVPEMAPTDGRVIDHIGFAYSDIEPVYDRMKADGVEIVRDIAWDEDFNMKSFYIRGPDGVLIEIAEANPLLAASWLNQTQAD